MGGRTVDSPGTPTAEAGSHAWLPPTDSEILLSDLSENTR
jgi:hypothetical protein